MAIGSAGTVDAGPVILNAPQSAANAATNPAAVLDDPANGALVTHLGGKGTAPGIAARGAGLGTSGTAALDAKATDLCGLVTLVTGSAAWGTGVQATVTYGAAHLATNYPVFSPADDATAILCATLQPAIVPVALTGFTIDFGVADSAAHTLKFIYHANGN